MRHWIMSLNGYKTTGEGGKDVSNHKYVVRETRNYGMFKLLEFNRDVQKIKNLEASFRNHGWIPAYPMHVIQAEDSTGKYIIKAGNHRFFVAKKLNMPVLYVVCQDEAEIFELEQATNHWKLKDYLVSGCRSGNLEYLEVKKYCEETGIPTGLSISMLAGQTAGGGNVTPKFKRGQFSVNKTSNHAQLVKEIVLLCKACEVPFYNKDLFVKALSRVLWVQDLDMKRLKSKIKLFGGDMKRKATLDQHLEQIEEIYNRNSTSKARLPLKFLALECAKQRSAVAA